MTLSPMDVANTDYVLGLQVGRVDHRPMGIDVGHDLGDLVFGVAEAAQSPREWTG